MAKRTLKNLITSDNWPIRRKWMFVVIGWMMLNAQYLIIWGADNALHQNALVTLLGAIVAGLGSYVFGSNFDDADKRKHAAQVDDGDE